MYFRVSGSPPTLRRGGKGWGKAAGAALGDLELVTGASKGDGHNHDGGTAITALTLVCVIAIWAFVTGIFEILQPFNSDSISPANGCSFSAESRPF